MKVVHLGTGVTPIPPCDEAAGIENWIYQLTYYLGKMGCHVDVIDIKGGAQQKKKRLESPVKFYEVWYSPLPHRRAHRQNFPFLQPFLNYLILMSQTFLFALLSSLVLNRLFGKEKIEVVHTHVGPSAIAAIIVNKLRRNAAVTVYNSHYAGLMTKLSWHRWLTSFAEILPLKWANHVVVDSPAIKRQLISQLNLDPAKISPIYAGIALDEIEQFLSHKARACHQSNIVLCVGAIHAAKNQFTAVKCIPQVIAVYPEVKFVFVGPVGNAGYFNSICGFIAKNNLSPCVEFKGMVTREALYNLYNDAILFLFPTTAESQGQVVEEAMAFGLPVIASNIKPIADIVSQVEGSAVLVDPYDVDGIAAAIIHLLEDSSLRQSMSQRGKKLAQRFSCGPIAVQTFSLYNQLIKNKQK